MTQASQHPREPRLSQQPRTFQQPQQPQQPQAEADCTGGGLRLGRLAAVLVMPLLIALLSTAAVGGPTPGTVRVERGDTLWALAQSYGTSVDELRRLNGVSGDRILIGQVLTVSDAAGTTGPAVAGSPASPVATATAPLAASVAAHRATLARAQVPTKAQTKGLITVAATRAGVPVDLALAIASMESGFNQRMVSPVDALGVMQVMPATCAWVASDVVRRPLDCMNAEDNITAGVALLATLLRATDQPTAIAAYYQGLASVRSRGPYADTVAYVNTVQSLRSRYR